MKTTNLKDHIKQTYGSVYRAARELGKTEKQLHRWIKAGALVDDQGNIRTVPAGGHGLIKQE